MSKGIAIKKIPTDPERVAEANSKREFVLSEINPATTAVAATKLNTKPKSIKSK